MSNKHPDNPIVGILAKAMGQDWVKEPSISEQHDTQDKINELECRLQIMEKHINELERKIELLMEISVQITESSIPVDDKAKKKSKTSLSYNLYQ